MGQQVAFRDRTTSEGGDFRSEIRRRLSDLEGKGAVGV